MRMLFRFLMGWVLASALWPAWAQNPVDVARVTKQAQQIHRTSMEEAAKVVGKPVAFVTSFLPGGKMASKKLSVEMELRAKQYRALRRIIAQRNYAIREAYSDAGLVQPTNTDIDIL